jgi:hypothetical protein
VANVADAILSCNGEQVIPNSGAISPHMDQCPAIAEVVSGVDVENSLLDAADGEPYVKPVMILYSLDPWAKRARARKLLARERAKETKEEGEKKGRGPSQEEGMGGTDEDSTLDAGSRGVSSISVASAALLSLDATRKRKRDEGMTSG